MAADRGFGRTDAREFRQTDPEGFLRVVAGLYHLRVNAGHTPDEAMDQLVERMVAEGVNLPLVMDLYPEATREWFDEDPCFDESVVVDTEFRIDRDTS